MHDQSLSAEAVVRSVLVDELGIAPERVAAFDAGAPLSGAVPELDSMAVEAVLKEMEDRFGFLIDEGDVDSATFETIGTLTAFAEDKLDASRLA